MSELFWLSDEQWAVMEPFMPRNQPGARRVDDRRVISGIVHVLKSGWRWRDCRDAYGPRTTVYNRFNRCARFGRVSLVRQWRATIWRPCRCERLAVRCPSPRCGLPAQPPSWFRQRATAAGAGAGATAVIQYAKPGSKTALAWLLALLERKPRKLAGVALANKMARIV